LLASWLCAPAYAAGNTPGKLSTSTTQQANPSQRILQIQNHEGGLLIELFVREGQEVEKDALLARIDNTPGDYIMERQRHTELRAPMRAMIKRIHFRTGAVIKPGEAVMDLVPLDDTLLD
jgi:multidrug resistance efflux pump